MDYGKPAFIDTQRIIAHPDNDPVQWNTSVGLQALAESLEMEFREINRKLDAILTVLQRK